MERGGIIKESYFVKVFSRRNSEFLISAFLIRLRLRSSVVRYFSRNSQF